MANKQLVINNEQANTEQKSIMLIACIAQELQAKMNKLLSPLGLSPIQSNILHVLDYGPEKGLTVNEIKSLQVEESPNVSRSLNKLMEKGCIVKKRNTKDQRVVHIQITKKGRELHRKADELTVPEIKLDLSKEDTATLYEILKKL